MPNFLCDRCQASLKKAQVAFHHCGGSFSCTDCGKTFFGMEYKAHTSCISEAEKYQKTMFHAKGTKREKKPLAVSPVVVDSPASPSPSASPAPSNSPAASSSPPPASPSPASPSSPAPAAAAVNVDAAASSSSSKKRKHDAVESSPAAAAEEPSSKKQKVEEEKKAEQPQTVEQIVQSLVEQCKVCLCVCTVMDACLCALLCVCVVGCARSLMCCLVVSLSNRVHL